MNRLLTLLFFVHAYSQLHAMERKLPDLHDTVQRHDLTQANSNAAQPTTLSASPHDATPLHEAHRLFLNFLNSIIDTILAPEKLSKETIASPIARRCSFTKSHIKACIQCMEEDPTGDWDEIRDTLSYMEKLVALLPQDKVLFIIEHTIREINNLEMPPKTRGYLLQFLGYIITSIHIYLEPNEFDVTHHQIIELALEQLDEHTPSDTTAILGHLPDCMKTPEFWTRLVNMLQHEEHNLFAQASLIRALARMNNNILEAEALALYPFIFNILETHSYNEDTKELLFAAQIYIATLLDHLDNQHIQESLCPRIIQILSDSYHPEWDSFNEFFSFTTLNFLQRMFPRTILSEQDHEKLCAVLLKFINLDRFDINRIATELYEHIKNKDN